MCLRRNLLLALIVCLLATPAHAAITFVASCNVAAGSTGGDNITTAGIDTTGANLIILALGYYGDGGAVTITDSKSNTWTPRTAYKDVGSGTTIRLYYAENPGSVGAAHTFTASSSGAFPSIAVACFAGAATATVYETENGATTNSATSLQAGSITPSGDDRLVTGALANGQDQTGSITINGSYNLTNTVEHSAGNHIGVSLAYIIQTTAAATNPTWSWTNATNAGATIAAFKPAGAAAVTIRGPMLGVLP